MLTQAPTHRCGFALEQERQPRREEILKWRQWRSAHWSTHHGMAERRQSLQLCPIPHSRQGLPRIFESRTMQRGYHAAQSDSLGVVQLARSLRTWLTYNSEIER